MIGNDPIKRGRGGFRGRGSPSGRGVFRGGFNARSSNEDARNVQRGGFHGSNRNGFVNDRGHSGSFKARRARGHWGQPNDRGREQRNFDKRPTPMDEEESEKKSDSDNSEMEKSALSKPLKSKKSKKALENSVKETLSLIKKLEFPELSKSKKRLEAEQNEQKDSPQKRKPSSEISKKWTTSETVDIASAMAERLNEKSNRRLCLKSLPGDTSVDDLKKMVPELSDWRLVSKGKFGNSMAFIDLPSEKLATKYHDILKSNNSLRDHKFVVDYCGTKSKFSSKELGPTGNSELDATRLYVTGLKPTYTVEEVEKLFPKALEVSKRGKRRGLDRDKSAFIYVQFKNAADAVEAFKKGEHLSIDGRDLTVLFAYKEKRKNAVDEPKEETVDSQPTKKQKRESSNISPGTFVKKTTKESNTEIGKHTPSTKQVAVTKSKQNAQQDSDEDSKVQESDDSDDDDT